MPPMKASRPKAMKWSKATIYWLSPVASSQPARGMKNWKEPNQVPILRASRLRKPGVAMAVEVATAKASTAKLRAMRKTDSKTITLFVKVGEKTGTAHPSGTRRKAER